MGMVSLELKMVGPSQDIHTQSLVISMSIFALLMPMGE